MIKYAVLFLVNVGIALSSDFSNYWYAGKAEVAVYDLEQSRYGEQRGGTATLIFVTEPFSKKKHVKLDNPKNAGKDAATVLKLNTVKKYYTGIYPYSVMASAFADVTTGHLYKATTSIQEWCGHVFSQANATGKENYKYLGFSYFESEGDESQTLKGTSLAEELMLKVRLNQITAGTVKMVLPQEMIRFLHVPAESLDVTISLEEGGKTTTLTASFDHPTKYEMKITYAKAFPYIIQEWSESFTKGGKRQTSTAKLKTVQRLPYWDMNSNRYNGARKEIGLQ